MTKGGGVNKNILETRGGEKSVLQEGGFGLYPSGGENGTLPRPSPRMIEGQYPFRHLCTSHQLRTCQNLNFSLK